MGNGALLGLLVLTQSSWSASICIKHVEPFVDKNWCVFWNKNLIWPKMHLGPCGSEPLDKCSMFHISMTSQIYKKVVFVLFVCLFAFSEFNCSSLPKPFITINMIGPQIRITLPDFNQNRFLMRKCIDLKISKLSKRINKAPGDTL